VLSSARKLWRRGRDFFPVEGFYFDRPLVVLQSDDWGRAGLRDQEGLEHLRSAGFALGGRPYDLYTLETADDVAALQAVLNRHCDSTGRPPCLEANFMVGNLDLARMEADGFHQIHLLPLAAGLPQGWHRAGLLQAYREAIDDGIFHPALHGITHFCRAAVERELLADGERAEFLRALWRAGTPYIHWRMPWIGFEYWDPEQPVVERFLPAAIQQESIGQAVGLFSKLFSMVPKSACAPGYRANDDTHSAWARLGIGTAQNGPGTLTPPHLDRHGLLQLYRNVEFEPATDPSFCVENCMGQADSCFARGVPVIVSIHSIHFHSSLSGFRDRTIALLDQFLSALEARHPDLLYLHDGDLQQLVEKGFFENVHATTRVNVIRKKYSKRQTRQHAKAK